MIAGRRVGHERQPVGIGTEEARRPPSRASASSPGRSPDRKRTGSDSRRSRNARWTSRTGSGHAPYEPWLRNVTVGVESPAEIGPHRATTGVEITSPERATTVSPTVHRIGQPARLARTDDAPLDASGCPGPRAPRSRRSARTARGHRGPRAPTPRSARWSTTRSLPARGARPRTPGRRGARPSRRRASRSTARTPSLRHWHRPGRRQPACASRDRGPRRRARHDRRDEVRVAAREVDDVRRRELGRRARRSAAIAWLTTGTTVATTSRPLARRDALERLDAVRAGQVRAPACRRGRDDGDPERPPGSGPRRGARHSSAARNASSPARNSPPPWSATGPLIRVRARSSGGVTFLIGGFGGSPVPSGPRPRPRATIRDSRPGATTNGAR